MTGKGESEILYMVVREGLTKKAIVEQMHEGSEEVNHGISKKREFWSKG